MSNCGNDDRPCRHFKGKVIAPGGDNADLTCTLTCDALSVRVPPIDAGTFTRVYQEYLSLRSPISLSLPPLDEDEGDMPNECGFKMLLVRAGEVHSLRYLDLDLRASTPVPPPSPYASCIAGFGSALGRSHDVGVHESETAERDHSNSTLSSNAYLLARPRVP